MLHPVHLTAVNCMFYRRLCIYFLFFVLQLLAESDVIRLACTKFLARDYFVD